MRLYEFAKQHNLSSKELVAVLQKAGFEVKSHMVVIDDTIKSFLVKTFLDGARISDTQNNINVLHSTIDQGNGMPTGARDTDINHLAESKRSLTEKVIASSKKIDSKKAFIENTSGIHAETKASEVDKVASVVVVPMKVTELAEKIKAPVNDVIVSLLRLGIVASKNQTVNEDGIKKLLHQYGIDAVKPATASSDISTQRATMLTEGKELRSRPPIVVIVGHVDHGKTTLLDFIRNTRVAAKEKGGITQHIGAYEVTTNHGPIIFLDTPGHEAFMKMRQRGVRVADIAVLVVAADDGIKPQTIEAIKHIKSLQVSVVVAITKIDKVDISRVDIIKRELSRYDIICEDWGGDVVCVPVSGKTGLGVDQLLEVLVLQGQIMDLRVSDFGVARGIVLESKLEKGRGVIATIICQQGTLHKQDFFVCGDTVGRVITINDSAAQDLKSAPAAVPVRVSGFEDIPMVGDVFQVVDKKDYLLRRQSRSTGEIDKGHLFTHTNTDVKNNFSIVVKVDTNSSKEALLDSIAGLNQLADMHPTTITKSGIGDITVGDVEFAANTHSDIVGLHVKVEANAIIAAKQAEVTIETFDVIYHLLEYLEKKAKKAVQVQTVKTKIGEAEVLKVFDIKGVGVIAGVYVNSGRIVKGSKVIVFRNKRKIGEGDIVSLQRDKKVVKEAHSGFECGFITTGFTEWQPHDMVEVYLEVEKK